MKFYINYKSIGGSDGPPEEKKTEIDLIVEDKLKIKKETYDKYDQLSEIKFSITKEDVQKLYIDKVNRNPNYTNWEVQTEEINKVKDLIVDHVYSKYTLPKEGFYNNTDEFFQQLSFLLTEIANNSHVILNKLITDKGNISDDANINFSNLHFHPELFGDQVNILEDYNLKQTEYCRPEMAVVLGNNKGKILNNSCVLFYLKKYEGLPLNGGYDYAMSLIQDRFSSTFEYSKSVLFDLIYGIYLYTKALYDSKTWEKQWKYDNDDVEYSIVSLAEDSARGKDIASSLFGFQQNLGI